MEENTSNRNRLFLILAAVAVLVIIAVVVLLQGGPAAVVSQQEVDQAQFIVKMNELVLGPKDMPVPYRIASGSNARFDNASAATAMGSELGKPYIAATGRVDGWDLFMERANATDIGPESYRSRVEIFETVEGASAAISEQWFWAYTDPKKTPTEWLSKNCNVGNECLSFMYQEAKPGAGAVHERYDVAFRYRNSLVWVFVNGVQGDVSEEVALDAARMILERIKALE